MEPTPVIPLPYAHIGPPAPALLRLRIVAATASAVCLIATVLIITVDVESVVITGPLIFILGVLLLIRAVRANAPRYMILGALHCAICLLFFMLVQLLHWGPPDASKPFAVMGTLYTILMGVVTLLICTGRRVRVILATSQ